VAVWPADPSHHRRQRPLRTSACIRSANIPAASSRLICTILTSPPTPGLRRVRASRSSGRRISGRFKEAQASGKPAIIRLAIDPEAINAGDDACEDTGEVAGGG